MLGYGPGVLQVGIFPSSRGWGFSNGLYQSLPNLKVIQVNTSENRLGIPYEI